MPPDLHRHVALSGRSFKSRHNSVPTLMCRSLQAATCAMRVCRSRPRTLSSPPGLVAKDDRRGADGVRTAVEDFIARWQGRVGGQERANYALFLTELCDVLGLLHPDPASAAHDQNDYVFERVVREPSRDGSATHRRIDLYKRDSFVLEAKQSRQKGGAKEVHGQANLFVADVTPRGRKGAEREWDVLMLNARRQAEDYVRLLPSSHEPPPFVIVCDVGHCLEVYANFRRDGKAFDQFPDRQSFRIYLDELRRPEVRERLVTIWTDPLSLDPARKAARVTRQIAERLAVVSKALEAQRHAPQEVAFFLMRCLFTMFAEDVTLLPEKSFKEVLERCEQDPSTFEHDVGQLWEAMDVGGYAHAIRKRVARFNGEFFAKRTVLKLGREEIGELRQAASYDWREVDPSIFGTLVEQALDAHERRRLGAHYTPRAYVERLVVATVIEPLRDEWATVLATIERKKGEIAVLGPSDPRRNALFREARAIAVTFHGKLCATRVLDPACGTGNFLYVSLELMKRLEGEVIDVVEALGGQEEPAWLERQNVDPHQFLGMEINPRAAAIAELVLWIGFLQWHFRTRTDRPPEPILHAFRNVEVRDALLTSKGALQRATWPTAEFIIGNPPFIGGKDIRARLGDGYAEALWAANPEMNDSADLVMYWWDHAAALLTVNGAILRRFGFVTTNSISQSFLRRVIERHLNAKSPVSIIMAVPDHPWRGNGKDNASVRIAMTVVEAGTRDGVLREVVREFDLASEAPTVDLNEKTGRINGDLTIGANVSLAQELISNKGLCSNGMKPLGAGFIVSSAVATQLGLEKRDGLERHIRPYRNGRDLTARARNVLALDFFGLSAEQLRMNYPEAYQHLAKTVKPAREASAASSSTRDAQEYAEKWWLFCKPRQELREFTSGLSRYIVTVQTAKHRVFQFFDANLMPDQKLMVFGLNHPYHLGVLSSRIHTIWTLRTCGWQGVGNDPVYVKTQSFDWFPFPLADSEVAKRIAEAANELDALRKRVLSDHPHLTLTKLYNVLEKLRAGVRPDALQATERRTFDDGLVLIMKEYHDKIDAAVADAYGWPADLSDDEILIRLVALNQQRAKEEARGLVRWLRPDYQIPKFGTTKDKAELDLVGGGTPIEGVMAAGPKPTFPPDDIAQTAAVMAALMVAPGPIDAGTLSTAFRQGRRVAPKVTSVLAALARMGFVSTADGGRTFTLRRAA